MDLIDRLLKGKERALKEIDAICARKKTGKCKSSEGIVVFTKESAQELIAKLKAEDDFIARCLLRTSRVVF